MSCTFRNIRFILPEKLVVIAKSFHLDVRGRRYAIDKMQVETFMWPAIIVFGFLLIPLAPIISYANKFPITAGLLIVTILFMALICFLTTLSLLIKPWMRMRNAIEIRGVKYYQEEIDRLKDIHRFAVWIAWMDAAVMNEVVQQVSRLTCEDEDEEMFAFGLMMTRVLRDVDDHLSKMIENTGEKFVAGHRLEGVQWEAALTVMDEWVKLLKRFDTIKECPQCHARKLVRIIEDREELLESFDIARIELTL